MMKSIPLLIASFSLNLVIPAYAEPVHSNKTHTPSGLTVSKADQRQSQAMSNIQVKNISVNLAGDFNGDNKTDLSDFGQLKNNFGLEKSYSQGDSDLDGDVDTEDFGVLKNSFGVKNIQGLGLGNVHAFRMNSSRIKFTLEGPEVSPFVKKIIRLDFESNEMNEVRIVPCHSSGCGGLNQSEIIKLSENRLGYTTRLQEIMLALLKIQNDVSFNDEQRQFVTEMLTEIDDYYSQILPGHFSRAEAQALNDISKGIIMGGDANADNVVDMTDFGALKYHMGNGTATPETDFNGDGKLDLSDFGILKSNFGKTRAEAGIFDFKDTSSYQSRFGVYDITITVQEKDNLLWSSQESFGNVHSIYLFNWETHEIKNGNGDVTPQAVENLYGNLVMAYYGAKGTPQEPKINQIFERFLEIYPEFIR